MTASRILVATDLRPESDEAIRQALAVAHGRHRVAICHVLPDLRLVRPLFPQLNSDDSLANVEAQQWAREAVDACLTRLGNPDVDMFFESGIPFLKVIDLAKRLKAELIVIQASHDSSRTTGTADGLVRHSPVPVLVAHESPRGSVVIAATDLSDPSIEALRIAARQAGALGLELVALHVVDVEEEASWLSAVRRLSDRATEAYVERMQTLVNDASKKLGEILVDVAPKAKGVVRQGAAVDEICKGAAELDASLIVVAAHGRSGVDAMLVGSVAEGVVRRAQRSVLVVRHAA